MAAIFSDYLKAVIAVAAVGLLTAATIAVVIAILRIDLVVLLSG